MAEDFVSGALAGQQFRQNAEALREQPQLFALSMAEGQTKVALGQMDLKERQSALDNAKAIQQIQSKALRMAQLGQGDPNADPVSQTTNMLQTMGLADIESGFPVQGAELLKQSVAISKDHAEIVSKQAETQQKKLSFVASGLDDVLSSKDPARAWRDFNMLAASEFKGALDPKIAQRPYDPEFVKMLRDTSQTLLQKAETDRDKAQASLARVEARKNEAEIPLEKARTQAEEALADERRKNAGLAGGPDKDDLKAAYDAVKGAFGPKDVSKEAAEAAALPIAERVAALRKGGMPRSQAVAKAIQEEKQKPNNSLEKLSKPPGGPAVDETVAVIDKLLGLLDQADAQNIDVTGIGGKIRKGKEYVGPKVGYKEQQIAHEFESQITLLQQKLPKAANFMGQFSKLKQEELQTIIRGRNLFDSKESARVSLQDARESLTGQLTKSDEGQPDSGGFVPNMQYTDAAGNTATYLGEGKWQTTP